MLLQDFTGVPVFVDLAAMREAADVYKAKCDKAADALDKTARIYIRFAAVRRTDNFIEQRFRYKAVINKRSPQVCRNLRSASLGIAEQRSVIVYRVFPRGLRFTERIEHESNFFVFI